MIEEDIAVLDSLDMNRVLDGSYGGKSSEEVLKENNTSTYSREPNDDDKAFAWVAAINAVKENLKAPSTAKFPFSYYDQDIKEISFNVFTVNSYVDAENSFGAKIRTRFMVKIEKTGVKSYLIKDIKLYE